MADGFSFLHAADLHLDSPLVGLSSRSPELAARVGLASRRAFERLVDLALAERCAFVILAGDCFDGDLRDVHSALAFLAGMARLGRAGVDAYVVAGNHDAESRVFGRLGHAGNVRLFDHSRAHTFLDRRHGVALHGRSFGRAEVRENLAATYPAPLPGHLNVGILHTALDGGEGDHARYAPCTLDQLANFGYQYWALGHVHARRTLREGPHVVYPGNVQGRSVRETGPKGAALVRVVDGAIHSVEHRDLDDVRWAREVVDVSGIAERAEVGARLRAAALAAADAAGGRDVALRLVLDGETPIHPELTLDRDGLREDAEAMLATLPATVWLERVELATRPSAVEAADDGTVVGRLAREVRRLGTEGSLAEAAERLLRDVRPRVPAGARMDELAARVRDAAPRRAVELALSLLSEAHDDADR